MSNKPMKITHTLSEDQQFTVAELKVGEVFTLGAMTLIMGHKAVLGPPNYICWDLEGSASVKVPEHTVVKHRVNAELILS